MYCKYCGREIRDESIYCKYCGKMLAKGESDPKSKDIHNENLHAAANNIYDGSEKTLKKKVKKIILVLIAIIMVAAVPIIIAIDSSYTAADSGDFNKASNISELIFWDNDFNKYVAAGLKYNEDELIEAHVSFEELNGYRESEYFIDIIESDAFNKAIKLFRSDEYESAYALFDICQNNKDAADYIKIIRYLYGELSVKQLFDDSNVVRNFMLSNTGCMIDFLTGNWETYDKNHYLTVTSDGVFYYNLPSIEFGDTLYFKNGNIYTYFEGKETKTKKDFEISLLSYEIIKVTCESTGETFSLYRS